MIDLKNPQVINEIEKNEIEKLNYKLGILIGITSNEENEEILNEIKRLIKENRANTENSEKRFSLNLFRKLKNRPKSLTSKKYKEEKQVERSEDLPEKLEIIRSEFRIKAAKIRIISEKWIEQYKDIQDKIIAIQQIEKTVDESIKQRIKNSINYLTNINLIIENQALTCIRLAQKYENTANNYETSQADLFAASNIENIINDIEKAKEEANRLVNNIETGLNQNANIENSSSESIEEER
ncbi:MAG: hypothetical protein HFJ60_06580 [Clostridia bacterium]|jgi:hypothetical protein|nr:hypothetical protein [Clostridia bacterium]